MFNLQQKKQRTKRLVIIVFFSVISIDFIQFELIKIALI